MINKNILLYYSLSGTNRKLAGTIADKLSADSEEIIDLTDRKNFLKTLFVGGFQAIRKIEVPIKPLKSNLEKYDWVILCSPVWAGSLPPATRTFLTHFGKDAKKLDFIFACGAGEGNRDKILPDLKRILGQDKVSAMFVKKTELNSENIKTSIFDFLNHQ